LPRVASILNIPEDPNRPLTISLLSNLREKHLLLILSHCDHLLGACAQFAETVLQTCPEVRILAVSRQLLNLLEEKHFPS
jgi:non-specific serine/threonine protein kinase